MPSAVNYRERGTKAKGLEGHHLDLPEDVTVTGVASVGTGYAVAEKAVVTDSG